MLMISSPHGIRRRLFHPRPSEFFVCRSDWLVSSLECPDRCSAGLIIRILNSKLSPPANDWNGRVFFTIFLGMKAVVHAYIRDMQKCIPGGLFNNFSRMVMKAD
jgi:hypothetical protein